jgi:SM-20-related protein
MNEPAVTDEPVRTAMPLPVFMRPAFLTDLECANLRAEMDRATRVEGGVREPDAPDSDSLDRTGRRASDCEVSDNMSRAVAERICRVAPEIGAYFGESLAECEAPHLVVYEPGDFYRPHRDLYPDVAVPEPLVRRRLSAVVFLNDRTHPGDDAAPGTADTATTYCGGSLRLCSHEADEFEPGDAWEVPAERGLLVAFRADTWHEVTPVTAGHRYAIVALLLAPGA